MTASFSDFDSTYIIPCDFLEFSFYHLTTNAGTYCYCTTTYHISFTEQNSILTVLGGGPSGGVWK